MVVTTSTLLSSNAIVPTPHNSSLSSSSSNPKSSNISSINRRELVTSLFITVSPFFAAPQVNNPTNANPISLPISEARGLFQMPPVRLTNRYYLVRAGESEYESLGIINTNPVAKTSVDNGLSERGKKQAIKAALALKSMGACETNFWIWPSITQRAYQAAEIIGAVCGISRSRIVPEYSFLDARGLGAYEGKKLDSVSEVYASDSLSPNMKPPPIDDGTPNESVSDVFVRVTQLMSILETQYSGDTVIIVSPDSDNLTVLQAGLVGLDLRRHRDLAFAPGEVRFVDASSIPTYKQPASAVYKCLNPPNCEMAHSTLMSLSIS
ncbi:Phosphoglycerate mutase family protein [Forsythia ovata]|uniref:Phosphoglycerate mutase family protein n=1 Tax=Forsythia ovata TaxID=205694 RepID=A0ABD1TSN2_9LAMI